MRTKFRIAAVILLLITGAVSAAGQTGEISATDATRERLAGDPADTRIPRNSKVYIAPAHGFENYLAAAFRKKSVPLLIVADREAADFEITTTNDKESASWARIYVWGLLHGSASASLQVVNLRTKVVVFADSSERLVALRGERSTAEKLAKYLKRKMEKDEKKARQNVR